MQTITLYWKCKCQKNEVSFTMRQRMADEDIIDYMERVQIAASVDHNNHSPLCRSPTMEYLKMPTIDEQPIGRVAGGDA